MTSTCARSGTASGGADVASTGLLVLIGGPIASGKSSIARALATTLERHAVTAAVIDLDLLYEMLDRRCPKNDERTWSRARRLAAGMADVLMGDGVEAVIVEGDVLLDSQRDELTSAIRARPARLDVTVRVPFEVALERVALDPTRGLSRDPSFLAEHYCSLADALDARPAGELVLDTATLTAAQAAERIVVDLETMPECAAWPRPRSPA